MEEDDDVFSLQVESTDLPSEPLEDYDAESPVLDWELQDTHTEHFFVQTEEEHHVESDSTEGGIEISPVVSTTPDSICSMAPPLVGKETSHVFFCYSPSDNEWVANVVRKLESPAYGFKCYNHELVCEPEKSKADLILSCTCCCKKVVVVLSSAFLESAWCQLDNAYVIQQLIKDTNKIIVVALNDCNAPHYLQHFVPVNAMSKSFWPRFIASLKQEIFVDVVNSFSNEHEILQGNRLGEGLYNGLELSRMVSENHLCSAEFDTFYCPDDLLHSGVAIPQKDYATGIYNLLQEPKLQWYTFCYSKPFSVTMCLLLSALLIVGLVGKASSFGVDGTLHWGWALVLATVLSAIIILLLLTVVYYEKIKLNKNLDFRLAKINASIMKHNILLGMSDQCICCCSHAVLHFIYYNTDQCIEQIQMFLSNQHVPLNTITQDVITLDIDAADDDTIQLTPSSKQEKNKNHPITTILGNIAPESYKEEAELLVLQYTSKYIRQLITRKLGAPKHHRHMPKGYCLCQYVEKEVFKMEI